MRCKICDWSPGIPGSILRSSIDTLDPSSTPPEAKEYDPETGTYHCIHCDNKSYKIDEEDSKFIIEDDWEEM